MSLIEWKEEFSVGDAAVDHEHRQLVELINGLHGALQSGCDREQVIDSLGEVYAQISAHFALEEKSMRDSRYPHYEEHKTDHEALLDQLRDIMDHVEDSESTAEDWLPDKLGNWFSEHFRTHDARLHSGRTIATH